MRPIISIYTIDFKQKNNGKNIKKYIKIFNRSLNTSKTNFNP